MSLLFEPGNRRICRSNGACKTRLVAIAVISLSLQACAINPNSSKSLVGGYARPLNTEGPTQLAAGTTRSGLYATFETAVNASKQAPADKGKALTMLAAGQALGRGACIEFFDLVGKAQQKHDMGKDILALGSNVVTGILAAVDASTGFVGGSALAFQALESGFDIRQQHVLFNPDTRSVETIALKAMDLHASIATSRASQNAAYSYIDAYNDLLDFERECTVHSIKSLVNAAIVKGDLTEPSLKARDEVVAMLEDESNRRVRSEIADVLGESVTLSADQLVALWWLYYVGRKDTNEIATICASLSTLANSPCATADTLKSPQQFTHRHKIEDLLRQLQPNLRRELEQVVLQTRSEMAAKIALQEQTETQPEQGDEKAGSGEGTSRGVTKTMFVPQAISLNAPVRRGIHIEVQ